MTAYGWSFYGEVYHQSAGAFTAPGWCDTACGCGERYLDATSGTRPEDRRPCDQQEPVNLLPAYRTCTVPGCGGIRVRQGFCDNHYWRRQYALDRAAR